MTTVILEKWKDEAEDWNDNGDPAFNTLLQAPVVRAEMKRKQDAFKAIKAESEKGFKELFKEVFGVDPESVGYKAGVGLSVVVLMGLIVKKFGSKIWDEIAGTIKDVKLHEKIDEVTEGPGRSARRSRLARRLGSKAATKAGILAIITALLAGGAAIGSAAAKRARLQELEADLAVLRRALRYEALQIDRAVYEAEGATFEQLVKPPEESDLAKKLANPDCHLICLIRNRYFDHENKRVVETDGVASTMIRGNDGTYSHKAQIAVNAVHASVLVTVTLYCKGPPEVSTVIYEAEIPYRTAVDPKDLKGKLPSEED